jgi:alkylation response protein AidB-like acyl-CoA dehydrogenase
MSEPEAGSDLAAVKTRAVRTPTGWRVSGQKVWTTNAQRCHYMIALVRTSGTAADRQKGLSQIIVDLGRPGVTVRPIHDIAGDAHFSEVFLEDVELDEDALVGKEGAGWEQVTAELAFERSGPERLYSSVVLVDAWLALARSGARPRAVPPAVLGRMAAHMAVLRAMSMSITDKLSRGESPALEASLVKDLGTELEQWIPVAIGDALAADPGVALPPSLLRALAYTAQLAPSFSLRGGTREILRGIVARGLGLR